MSRGKRWTFKTGMLCKSMFDLYYADDTGHSSMYGQLADQRVLPAGTILLVINIQKFNINTIARRARVVYALHVLSGDQTYYLHCWASDLSEFKKWLNSVLEALT